MKMDCRIEPRNDDDQLSARTRHSMMIAPAVALLNAELHQSIPAVATAPCLAKQRGGWNIVFIGFFNQLAADDL